MDDNGIIETVSHLLGQNIFRQASIVRTAEIFLENPSYRQLGGNIHIRAQRFYIHYGIDHPVYKFAGISFRTLGYCTYERLKNFVHIPTDNVIALKEGTYSA